jgi:hypothetical protein
MEERTQAVGMRRKRLRRPFVEYRGQLWTLGFADNRDA